MTALVVPAEFKANINYHSGYLMPGTKFAGKNLKGLFFTSENQTYLANELYQMITYEPYVKDNSDLNPMMRKKLIASFQTNRSSINQNIYDLMKAQAMPFYEDLLSQNPIQQLHVLNLNFLTNTAKNIIQVPEMLVSGFNRINPDTLKDEGDVEYDYNAESYADGTWHPEHLFTNSKNNRENPYWVPLEVSINTDPSDGEPGHKYYDSVYFPTTRNNKSQFPIWQTSVQRRNYERDVNDGLEENGMSDRRVQKPRGYDMSNLIRKKK